MSRQGEPLGQFRCVGPSCPGLAYRASETAHPASCLEAAQEKRPRRETKRFIADHLKSCDWPGCFGCGPQSLTKSLNVAQVHGLLWVALTEAERQGQRAPQKYTRLKLSELGLIDGHPPRLTKLAGLVLADLQKPGLAARAPS